ncbi:MAG: phosphotransferase [Candidatus Heimdallarchaeota archaeon]|nr:phosphotransferase [Candidatus Heimdallarchaeota archaeon]
MKLSKPIALGRTAEVYNWNENQIVKLYYKTWGRENVEYEFKISNIVSDLGLQVPEVLELVEYDGRNGIVYEKLKGKSMLQLMKTKPFQIGKFGKLLAELHCSFSEMTVKDLPKQFDVLEHGINKRDYITEVQKSLIIDKLKKLPQNNQLCHNDFHPDNVLITDDGPYIIDWMTVSQGNSLGDFARSCLMLQIGTPPSGLIDRMLTGFFRSRFFKGYSKRYFELIDVDREELEAWELPIATHRLNDDNISHERDQLLKMIRSSIE